MTRNLARAAPALVLFAALAAALVARFPARAAAPESATVRAEDGATWIGANDLARLLSATKFWRHDVRKLVLRAGEHRLLLTVDNPFVLIDDRTVRLPRAVRSVRGELQVPVALLESLPRDSTIARLHLDARRGVVLQVPPAGLIGTPRIAVGEDATRIVFDVDQSGSTAVTSRSRAHFLVHFDGVFVGTLPDTLPEASLVRAIRLVPAASGTTFELEVAPATGGFRIAREPERRRATLVFARQTNAGDESFAPEAHAGPQRLRTVAIDAGHGGADQGVVAGGAVEKDLALQLARLVGSEIGRRLGARVVMVREDDRALSIEERAQRANRARADLVLSLHFDGAPSGAARGATAFYAPATYAAEPGGTSGTAGPIDVLPWRDAALRHAVESRALAERILGAIDLRLPGPTRLREMMPCPMLGVDAPGLLLECAMLTSEADRARITSARGLSELATAIVDGIEAFQASR